MRLESSTLIVLVGLASFFLCIVFLWIIAFRRVAKRMVTNSRSQMEEGQRNVRLVEVPIAGAVDGGPAMGGRMMLVARRVESQTQTVRQMISPPPSPVRTPAPVSVSIPDETPPADIAQQQTQALPAARLRLGGTWRIAAAQSPKTLPRDCWN